MHFLICFIAWEGIYYVLNFVPVLHYFVQEILLYQKLSRVGARVWCGIKVSELAYNMTLDTVKNRSWTAWIQAYILGLRIPFLRLTPVAQVRNLKKCKIWHISVCWGWDFTPLHMSACCACWVCCSPGRERCSIWAAWPDWTSALSNTFVLCLHWEEDWPLQFKH